MYATPKPTPRERAKWRHQPDWFVTQRLGVTLRQEQKQILKALRNNPWVAVQAPNGSGKTYAAALAVIWWMMAHDEAIAITTAPTIRQVRNQIWREIHNIYRRNHNLIGGKLTNTSLEFDDRHFALGFATNAAERFQGFHSENILVIADEAAAISEKIFDAIFACLTSTNAKLLILGNPTKPNGTLHNALKNRKSHWKTIQTQIPPSRSARGTRQAKRDAGGCLLTKLHPCKSRSAQPRSRRCEPSWATYQPNHQHDHISTTEPNNYPIKVHHSNHAHPGSDNNLTLATSVLI